MIIVTATVRYCNSLYSHSKEYFNITHTDAMAAFRAHCSRLGYEIVGSLDTDSYR